MTIIEETQDRELSSEKINVLEPFIHNLRMEGYPAF